jgi:hypothetical protein
MMDPRSSHRSGGAAILHFPPHSATQGTDKPIPIARTVELYSTMFPTPEQLLTLFGSWLFTAERDGVDLRQPEYAVALKRAITALSNAHSVPEAIAILRVQETTAASLSSLEDAWAVHTRTRSIGDDRSS